MQKIEDYYRRTEPSSPVPLIMMRAKTLVGRNFIECLEDLSPTAIDAVETVSGKSASELYASPPAADFSGGGVASSPAPQVDSPPPPPPKKEEPKAGTGSSWL